MASRIKLLGVINRDRLEKRRSITRDTLDELINTFMTVPYKTEDSSSIRYLQQCRHLFKLDYAVGYVNNSDGTLCAHYPPTILIPERELTDESKRGMKEQIDPAIEHRRMSDFILQNRNGESRLNYDETPSGQLGGWVHVATVEDTKSVEISAYHEVGECGSYAVIDGNSKFNVEENTHNGVGHLGREVSYLFVSVMLNAV